MLGKMIFGLNLLSDLWKYGCSSFDFVFDSECELTFVDCAVLVQPYCDLQVWCHFQDFFFFLFLCLIYS